MSAVVEDVATVNLVNQDVNSSNEGLAQQVINVVKAYMASQTGKGLDLNLHGLVIEAVEAPLLRTVLELCRYNQSKAARMLGISRGTLRAKLKLYFEDEFIGTREN